MGFVVSKAATVHLVWYRVGMAESQKLSVNFFFSWNIGRNSAYMNVSIIGSFSFVDTQWRIFLFSSANISRNEF